jgi:HEPN domain-containing protein
MTNSQFSNELRVIACQDLKAAKHLYKGGFYPQAVFYLQQSVEKGLKSYSVSQGFIDEEESRREISHKTLKIYEKNMKELRTRSIAQQEILQKTPQLAAAIESRISFTEFNAKLKELDHNLRKMTKPDAKSFRLSDEEMKKALKSIQDIHRNTSRERKRTMKKAVTPSEFQLAKREFAEFLTITLSNQPIKLEKIIEELDRVFTKEYYEKSMKEILCQIYIPMEVYSSLFELSIILQPHAVARYPKPGFNPVDFYTKNLPLVKFFPRLTDITDRILTQIDDLRKESLLKEIYLDYGIQERL